MAEKTHCDRCDVVTGPSDRGVDDNAVFVDLPGDGFDLCTDCISAFRLWVARGSTEGPQPPKDATNE